MNRSTALSVSLVLCALSAAAGAAEPGFYFAATASRVEHDVEGYLGPRAAVADLILPPVDSGIVPEPIFSIPINPGFPVFAAPSSQIDEVDAGFSATVGYRINRYLAGELTYTDFGEYERIDRFPGFGEDRYELGVRGLSVSVLGSLPLGEQWELFLRGGALFADQEVKAWIVSYDYSDEVLFAGAGVQWSFAPRWATRLEYQRTGDMKYDNDGESSIEQASLSVLFKL